MFCFQSIFIAIPIPVSARLGLSFSFSFSFGQNVKCHLWARRIKSVLTGGHLFFANRYSCIVVPFPGMSGRNVAVAQSEYGGWETAVIMHIV